MKILLGNNTLSLLAGSETWTLTLALELKKLGHEVTAFSPDLGLIAAKLEAEGIHCIKAVETKDGVAPFNPYFEEDQGSYDVVICNHNHIARYLKAVLPNVPMICTIHGIIHKNEETGEIYPEHPALDTKVDKYVCVSEEIQEMLLMKYNIESEIIRNSIDLDRFKIGLPLPTKPHTFLVNSNYWGVDDPINKVIEGAAEKLGARLMGIGANFVGTYEVETIIKDADVVFGMGRSVLEAAAMGKLSVCHGRWGTGGVLTPESMKELCKTNFSGRSSLGRLYTVDEMVEEITKHFTQENVDAVWAVMNSDHNAVKAAEKYLEIAKQLCEK